ncbi:hypothetical protein TIFTF001_022438 [Ficus carica]|uniref:3'-5' exonuclease domain-containing protein n=1 Tax=Ficus carica TaxID=3494 RepID=A0AA88AIN2_FICCA|nr:hypothetical protein TIFTF001_022438 [Ficus carica]
MAYAFHKRLFIWKLEPFDAHTLLNRHLLHASALHTVLQPPLHSRKITSLISLTSSLSLLLSPSLLFPILSPPFPNAENPNLSLSFFFFVFTAMASQEIVIDLDFDTVLAVVTSDPSAVDSWISDIERIHRRRLDRLVVGLDVEWRPSYSYHRNPVAVLQLCVGRRCLVFQILYAPYVPRSLHDFLGDDSYTFVGVGIDKDAEKIEQEHDLTVENTVDLGALAAAKHGMNRLRYAGLKGLAKVVLDVDIEKPREVTLSAWDSWNLSFQQIRYAVTDAFVSFEMGRVLEAWEPND